MSSTKPPSKLPEPQEKKFALLPNVSVEPPSIGLTITKNGTFGLVIEKATESPSNNRTFTDHAPYSTRLHYHVRTALSPQNHPIHKRRYLWNTREELERNPMGWKFVPKPKEVDDDIPVAVLRLDWAYMDKDIAADKREINPFDLLELRPGVPASDLQNTPTTRTT